jgi:hypothetical protein
MAGTTVGCFDIDTTNDQVYVGSGTSSSLRITRFNASGSYLGATSSSNSFPHIIKVSQHPSSNTIYVLANDGKIDLVESSSSDSSGGFTSSSSESPGFSGSSSSDSSFLYSVSSDSFSSSDSSSSSFGCDLAQVISPPNPGGGNVNEISITNDCMAIGNVTYDTSGNNNRGCVYLYEYSGGTWNYDTIFVGGSDGDLYGRDVNLDDSQPGQRDLAISTRVSNTTIGTVEVYRNNGGGGISAGIFNGESVGDWFGSTIRIHNGKMVIGASVTGYLYTYEWSSGWSFANKLDSVFHLGIVGSVDIYGDWIVAGDSSFDSGNGVVYVYKWNGATFSSFQTLSSLGSSFGRTVSVSGQTIIVNGRWIYEFNGSSWVYSSDLGFFTNPNHSSMNKDALLVSSINFGRLSVNNGSSWSNIQEIQSPPFSFFKSSDLNDRQIVFTNGTNVYVYECENELLSLSSSSSEGFSESSSSS